MINAGFSWVRIDKGNIHCTFRYLNIDQVKTVIAYLQSFYEYHNVSAEILDLSGSFEESAAHYVPSTGRDSTGLADGKSYYYLVELHRHGTLIPQGCITILQQGINQLCTNAIGEPSIFISKLSTNILSVDDEIVLRGNSIGTGAVNYTWTLSDAEKGQIAAYTPDDNYPYSPTPNYPGVDPDPGTTGDYGDTVTNSTYIKFKAIESGMTTVQVVGELVDTSLQVNVTYPATIETDTEGNLISAVYILDSSLIPDDAVFGTFMINGKAAINPVYNSTQHSVTILGSDGNSKPASGAAIYATFGTKKQYTGTYTIKIKSYVKILPLTATRLCLYKYMVINAESPTATKGEDSIEWTTSSNIISLDYDSSGTDKGQTLTVQGLNTGSTTLRASIADSAGTYSDSAELTVFAIDVTPDAVKLIVGQTYVATISNDNIFSTSAVVNWSSTSDTIAACSDVEGDLPTGIAFQQNIIPAGVGVAYIKAVAEDTTTGLSYQDSVKVTVGNVAIKEPTTKVLTLVTGGVDNVTLELAVASGYSVPETYNETDSTGTTVTKNSWKSTNETVATVTFVDGTHAKVQGLAVGTTVISVIAHNDTIATLSDTDTIIITVLEAPVASAGEMVSFTHGMYDGHGTVDWEESGESECVDTESSLVEAPTETEVTEFINDLFDSDES